jgi:hypothetical protein
MERWRLAAEPPNPQHPLITRRLAPEAQPRLSVAGGDHFERDAPVEIGIMRAENFSHRAAADLIDEHVLAQAG